MCSSWYSLKVAETHETGGWEWYVAEPVTRRAPAETGSPALIEREQAMPPLVVVTEIDRPPREVFAYATDPSRFPEYDQFVNGAA
jgi:hypothetical protein